MGLSLVGALKAAAAGFVAGGPVGAAAAFAVEAGKQVYRTEEEKEAARAKRAAYLKLHPEQDTRKPGYISPEGNVLVAVQWESHMHTGGEWVVQNVPTTQQRVFVRYWATPSGPLRTYPGDMLHVPAGATWKNGEIRQPFRAEEVDRYMAKKSAARQAWDAFSDKVASEAKTRGEAAIKGALGAAPGKPAAGKKAVTAGEGDYVNLVGVRITSYSDGKEIGYTEPATLPVARIEALLKAYDARLAEAYRAIDELKGGPPVETAGGEMGPPEPPGTPAAPGSKTGAILTGLLAVGAVAATFLWK